MPHGRKVGLDPGDIVVDGDTAPLPKKGASPQFSAHVYCGQTVVATAEHLFNIRASRFVEHHRLWFSVSVSLLS